MGIPNGWLFRYFQLRNATEAHLGLRDMHLYNSKLEHVLLSPEHTWLVSTFYSLLRDRPSASKF